MGTDVSLNVILLVCYSYPRSTTIECIEFIIIAVTLNLRILSKVNRVSISVYRFDELIQLCVRLFP